MTSRLSFSTANQHNFDMVETNNLGTPYDYSSIMHYSKSVCVPA